MRCLFVYNKIDMTTIEECDRIMAMPDTMVLSCQVKLNLDVFLDKIWEYLGLVRVYTKPRGKKPDFSYPLVLTDGRYVTTVEVRLPCPPTALPPCAAACRYLPLLAATATCGCLPACGQLSLQHSPVTLSCA